MEKVAIFGTSGFAYEASEVAIACGCGEVVHIAETQVENDPYFPQRPESEVDELREDGFCFAIGIASGRVRRQIASRYTELPYLNLIHPSAVLAVGVRESIEQSRGIVVSAGVVFTTGVQLNDFVTIHANSFIGHESELGHYSSVMPGANVCGNVVLGPCSYIGAGATVLPGSRECKMHIGQEAVVGAGAVVTKNIPRGVTVVGIPASKMNLLGDE